MTRLDLTGPGHPPRLELARVLECGVVGEGLGGDESGDAEVLAAFEGGALAGVIDGLGHGPEAALAARLARAVLVPRAGEPVDELIRAAHEALRETRGAVMSLASFLVGPSTMTWVGVGNVDAVLHSAQHAPARADLIPRAGIVGYQLPPLRPVSVVVAPGDVLVMASDGLWSSFALGPCPEGPASEVAARLFREHVRGSDDALLLCARYLGGMP